MRGKRLVQRYFPRWLWWRPRLLALLPGVKAAGWYAQHLTETPHRVSGAVLGDETIAAHWWLVCENAPQPFGRW